MNDVRLHVPYIFGNKQNSKREEDQTDRERSEEKQKEERPVVGQENKREAKLKHGNLQISKRFMYHYKDIVKYKC